MNDNFFPLSEKSSEHKIKRQSTNCQSSTDQIFRTFFDELELKRPESWTANVLIPPSVPNFSYSSVSTSKALEQPMNKTETSEGNEMRLRQKTENNRENGYFEEENKQVDHTSLKNWQNEESFGLLKIKRIYQPNAENFNIELLNAPLLDDSLSSSHDRNIMSSQTARINVPSTGKDGFILETEPLVQISETSVYLSRNILRILFAFAFQTAIAPKNLRSLSKKESGSGLSKKILRSAALKKKKISPGMRPTSGAKSPKNFLSSYVGLLIQKGQQGSLFPSLREGNQLPSANWKGSIEQLQEQSFLGCKVRSVHGETGFLSFEPIQISISVEKPEKFSVSLENEESGISRLPVLDVSPAKLLKQGIQESEPVRKKSSSVAQKKLSILQLPSQSLIFVYPGKFIQKNTLCAEISRVRAPLAMDSKKTNALAPHLLLQRNAAENKVEGQFEKPSASGEHVLNQSSEGFQRLVSPVVPEQNSETSVEIADNRVKNVLSEIQGQVALAPCGPNGVSQEVWVLAGEQYSLRALLSVPSALTSKVGFASKNSQEAQDTCKPTKSFQQQAFQVGDLFHWQGCRPSSPLSLFPVLKKQRVVAKRSGPATSSRLPQNINEAPSFELREGVILYAREQKTLISRSKDEALFTSISGLFPGAAFEKQNLALRSKSIGELIRNGDQIQYTTQIIRRQARLPHSRTIMEKTKKSSNRSMRLESSGKNDSILTKPFSYVLRRVQPHLFSGGVLAFDKDIREQSSPNHLSFQNQSKFSAPRHKPLNLRPIGSVVQEREILFQLSLPVEQSKTGDIVQGLPKIEQLFEGRGGSLFDEGVDQNSEKFQRSERSSGFGLQSGRVVLTSAVASDPAKKRFILQRRLVDEIQSVYQSQGVEIADKHVEIIVRQMTSKVKILEKGNTPFFPDDIVDFESLRRINPEHTSYEPIILGITKVAFFTESFISAASFQETKRVLMHSAIQTRVDFLTGLKENVIVGRLIPAGTGQMSV